MSEKENMCKAYFRQPFRHVYGRCSGAIAAKNYSECKFFCANSQRPNKCCFNDLSNCYNKAAIKDNMLEEKLNDL